MRIIFFLDGENGIYRFFNFLNKDVWYYLTPSKVWNLPKCLLFRTRGSICNTWITEWWLLATLGIQFTNDILLPGLSKWCSTLSMSIYHTLYMKGCVFYVVIILWNYVIIFNVHAFIKWRKFINSCDICLKLLNKYQLLNWECKKKKNRSYMLTTIWQGLAIKIWYVLMVNSCQIVVQNFIISF